MELPAAPPLPLDQSGATFESFDLDDRLMRALFKMGFKKPTMVQSGSIKLAQEGKDILARARTGSGKTVAYGIPVVDRLLKEAAQGEHKEGIKALILVPTSELSDQVRGVFNSLMRYCKTQLQLFHLTSEMASAEQRSVCDPPDPYQRDQY